MRLLLTLAFFCTLLAHVPAQIEDPTLRSKIGKLDSEEALISEERKAALLELSKEVAALLDEKKEAKLTFVCTHNSRRSQLSEIWMRAAATYYDVPNIYSFSGGTESTAFNKRMVQAVTSFGFDIEKISEDGNPMYHARINPNDEPIKMFSKKYDDDHNPATDFIAVMVCSSADKACPIVPGAFARVALPYLDPKASDDTPEESETYYKKVEEIGREILFMTKSLKAML